MSLAFEHLAEALRTDPIDESDEHARWAIYRAAVADEALLGLLYEALKDERESSLASAVVVLVLERTERSRHAEWIDILGDEHRGFSDRRSAELGILEDLMSERIPMVMVRDSLGEWSDWLQLKIAESVRISDVLEFVSREGRTKRIRRIASESLRTV
ncbi:hypothetical protein ACFQ7W_37745 [Streptomyces niveus]|uniref:hypothetical protein n=1 Tax=Streptomyces niveus TaxID=193462 RepID=UPI00369E43E6